jgi:serine-type D-Ala-D-Ala carboxypeptidase/endopeptidase
MNELFFSDRIFMLKWPCICGIFACITAYMPVCGQGSLLQNEIRKIIHHETQIDFSVVPGLAVTVWDGDSTYQIYFGSKMDTNGIYETGSVTKPIVGWLVEQALDSLRWNREDPVCNFIPDSLCSGDWKKLTLSQVLEHRTGMSRFPPGIGRLENSVQDPYLNYGIENLAGDLKSISPLPGMYNYSHTAYAMLHWLFEIVGGLESFTEQKLIQPLSLHHSGWNIADQQIAPGHGKDGRPHPPWHANAMKTAIGFKSSLKDMMSIVRHFSPALARQTPVLNRQLKKQLNTLGRSGAYKVQEGWFLIRSGSSLVYYHNGRTGGHHMSVAFMPAAQLGVVVISNGSPGSNDLSLLVLNMLRRARVNRG